jgi:iron complex outermembrane receptor protein
VPSRLLPVASVVAALSILASGHAMAAEDASVAELQAEIARLKQALAAQQGGVATPAAVAPAAAAPESAAPADVAKPDAAAGDGTQSLGRVTVRSRNRIEKVQDVPLSVSVVSSRELERELSLDIGAIAKRASNFERNTGNSRTYSLSIRGVGKVSQTEAQDTSVGVIQDGVNLAYAPLSSFDFFDVDSVEVNRGPQGTLLGKNSTMGVVVVNNKKPSFVPDAAWSVTLGQRNTVISQFAGGGPVIDDVLAWRGSVTLNKGKGYYQNKYNPDQTYYDRDRVAGRVQFLFTPTSDFSARAVLDRQPSGGEYYNGLTVRTPTPATYANGGSTLHTGNSNTTATNTLDIGNKLGRRWFTSSGRFDYADWLSGGIDLDNQRPLITSTQGASLELKWKVLDHELTSITAYRDYHFHARNDEGTPFDIQLNGGGKVDAYRQQSQEFRLASTQGGFVDYQAGLLFFRNTVDFGQMGYNQSWGSDAGAWFATNAQYAVLDADGAGRTLLQDSLDGATKSAAQYIKNKSVAVYGQADWHLSEALTLTTGLRLTKEDRRNAANSLVDAYGRGGAGLNAVSSGNVQLGGFDSVAFSPANVTAGTAGSLTNANSAAQTALANAVAQKYFGVATYAGLSNAQRAQVAAAKAIRATQFGTLFNTIDAAAFRKTQPGLNLSQSYKINEDQTTYLTLQYGEKGGVAQVVNGVSRQAAPEKVTSLEWGLKSAFLDKTLFLNTDIFQSNVLNYQQPVVIPDPLNPATTVSYTGNAERVIVRGLEVDGAYTGIRNTTLRFAGAYNEAKYRQFTGSPIPAEINPSAVGQLAYQDVSGQFLSGASRYTFNVGAEYRLPIFGDKVFHTSFNTAFKSRWNSDANLSAYSWINSRFVTDLSAGFGRADGKFDVNVIVKNAFDDRTPQGQTWNTITPGDPRWIGIQFSGKL